MSDLEDNAKRAANSSMMVAEGVLSGFILMAVPLLFCGRSGRSRHSTPSEAHRSHRRRLNAASSLRSRNPRR